MYFAVAFYRFQFAKGARAPAIAGYSKHRRQPNAGCRAREKLGEIKSSGKNKSQSLALATEKADKNNINWLLLEGDVCTVQVCRCRQLKNESIVDSPKTIPFEIFRRGNASYCKPCVRARRWCFSCAPCIAQYIQAISTAFRIESSAQCFSHDHRIYAPLLFSAEFDSSANSIAAQRSERTERNEEKIKCRPNTDI